MKLRVLVRLKAGILDVPGAAVKRALGGLGFDDVADLRIGKLIEIELRGPDAEARARVEEMCRKLLANPILEDFTIETVAADDTAASARSLRVGA
jgi:phosphoribosylformylglycinamidine synthase